MPPVGFELTISAGEWPQIYALDRAATGTGNRNEYQEYFLGVKDGLCVGLTTLPPSCDDCYEIWELQPFGTLRACPGLYMDYFTFYRT